MQAKYYLQNMMVNRVSNDDEFLGVDAEISPDIIGLMGLKQETIRSQQAARADRLVIKLDEYELAMAS